MTSPAVKQRLTAFWKREAEMRGAHPRPAREGAVEGDTTTCRHCDTEQPEHFQRYCESCGRLMTDGVQDFGGDE